MSEIPQERLDKVKEADKEGLLIKETARKTGMTEEEVKKARKKLISKKEIKRRKSKVRGEALREAVIRLSNDPRNLPIPEMAAQIPVKPQSFKNIRSRLIKEGLLDGRPAGRRIQEKKEAPAAAGERKSLPKNAGVPYDEVKAAVQQLRTENPLLPQYAIKSSTGFPSAKITRAVRELIAEQKIQEAPRGFQWQKEMKQGLKNIEAANRQQQVQLEPKSSNAA